MDEGPALSPHERKILADIEQSLESDIDLQRTLHSRPRLRAIARRPSQRESSAPWPYSRPRRYA